MALELSGRVAVVTGGGEGIGRGIAHALAASGSQVAVADIDLEAAERVAAELSDAGHEAVALPVDVSDRESVGALAVEVERRLGPAAVLCNNAGVMLDGRLAESALTDWRWVMGVNLMGVVHGVQAFVPQLRASGAGHIVNTGSMAGLAPRTSLDYGIYSASKAAVVSYSENLHAELAPEGIGVSVLCPSTVSTRIWEADRTRPPQLGAGRSVPRPARAAEAISGMDVGPMVLRGIALGQLYIFTSDDARPRIAQRDARLRADLDLHEGLDGASRESERALR